MITHKVYTEEGEFLARLKPINEIWNGLLKTYFLIDEHNELHGFQKGWEIFDMNFSRVGVLDFQVPGTVPRKPADYTPIVIRQTYGLPGEDIYEYPQWDIETGVR